MNETSNIKATGTPRSIGAKVLGIVLSVIGWLLVFAIFFPYIGLFVAVIGLLIAFVGMGLFAYGSKRMT